MTEELAPLPALAYDFLRALALEIEIVGVDPCIASLVVARGLVEMRAGHYRLTESGERELTQQTKDSWDNAILWLNSQGTSL